MKGKQGIQARAMWLTDLSWQRSSSEAGGCGTAEGKWQEHARNSARAVPVYPLCREFHPRSRRTPNVGRSLSPLVSRLSSVVFGIRRLRLESRKMFAFWRSGTVPVCGRRHLNPSLTPLLLLLSPQSLGETGLAVPDDLAAEAAEAAAEEEEEARY